MNCCSDCMHGLRYDGFSIVYMQIFSIEQLPGERHISELLDSENKNFINRDDSAIDGQIFVFDPARRPVVRYKLKGFDFKVALDEPYDVTVEGHIYVEMSVFFNKTVSLSYRMVVDGDICRKSELLTTDHLIELASLTLGAEHWSQEEGQTQTNINLDVKDVEVSHLFLNKTGQWITAAASEGESLGVMPSGNSLNEVCRRYKLYVLKASRDVMFPKKKSVKKEKLHMASRLSDMNYAFIDIWESVKHHDDLFGRISEGGIISHIVDEHKSEMVGLMSLYPAEWPYRTQESYEDVCGGNVAIDTDDLILVNENICVVFGTYGLRGGAESPTDWEEHLKERSHFHVSWPEYMLILEMVLAKKYTISYASDVLLDSVLGGDVYLDPQKAIEGNARVNLELTKLLMQLDAVKYSKFVSHKIMFDRTMARLNIDEEAQKLEEMMDRIDNSLNNISEMHSMKQGSMLNVILGGISVASLFEIIFMDMRIPFLAAMGVRSDRVSMAIVWFTVFLIVSGLLFLFAVTLNNKKHK